MKINNFLKHEDELKRKFQLELNKTDNLSDELLIQDKFLTKFNDFLQENLSNENLDIDFLVNSMAMSRSQLYRKILSVAGMSVKDYVRLFRLKVAEQLLHEKDIRISDVMYKIGMNSRSSFIGTFKKIYKLTPSDYVAQLIAESKNNSINI